MPDLPHPQSSSSCSPAAWGLLCRPMMLGELSKTLRHSPACEGAGSEHEWRHSLQDETRESLVARGGTHCPRCTCASRSCPPPWICSFPPLTPNPALIRVRHSLVTLSLSAVTEAALDPFQLPKTVRLWFPGGTIKVGSFGVPYPRLSSSLCWAAPRRPRTRRHPGWKPASAPRQKEQVRSGCPQQRFEPPRPLDVCSLFSLSCSKCSLLCLRYERQLWSLVAAVAARPV